MRSKINKQCDEGKVMERVNYYPKILKLQFKKMFFLSA